MSNDQSSNPVSPLTLERFALLLHIQTQAAEILSRLRRLRYSGFADMAHAEQTALYRHFTTDLDTFGPRIAALSQDLAREPANVAHNEQSSREGIGKILEEAWSMWLDNKQILYDWYLQLAAEEQSAMSIVLAANKTKRQLQGQKTSSSEQEWGAYPPQPTLAEMQDVAVMDQLWVEVLEVKNRLNSFQIETFGSSSMARQTESYLDMFPDINSIKAQILSLRDQFSANEGAPPHWPKDKMDRVKEILTGYHAEMSMVGDTLNKWFNHISDMHRSVVVARLVKRNHSQPGTSSLPWR